jgi:hypothetical protein
MLRLIFWGLISKKKLHIIFLRLIFLVLIFCKRKNKRGGYIAPNFVGPNSIIFLNIIFLRLIFYSLIFRFCILVLYLRKKIIFKKRIALGPQKLDAK